MTAQERLLLTSYQEEVKRRKKAEKRVEKLQRIIDESDDLTLQILSRVMDDDEEEEV